MKRTILYCVYLLCTLLCYSQDRTFPKNSNDEYEFSEVVEITLSKKTLYSNALSWAMSFYEEFKSVVQLESETDGRLVIKDYDLILYSDGTKEHVYYTLTIDCKDNKFRYIINDITIKDYTPNEYSIVLGIDMASDVNHEQHLEKCKELGEKKKIVEEQLQKANATLSGRKLKKETKKLKEQLDDIDKKMEKEEYLYNEEFDTFDRIIKGLKKKMIVNTDF